MSHAAPDPTALRARPVPDPDAASGGGGPRELDREGVVVSVTFHGADDAAVFRADLAPRLPAPGQVAPLELTRLVWHGRTRVPGVMPGARMRVSGPVVSVDGVPTLHNPRYDLLAGQGRA